MVLVQTVLHVNMCSPMTRGKSMPSSYGYYGVLLHLSGGDAGAVTDNSVKI